MTAQQHGRADQAAPVSTQDAQNTRLPHDQSSNAHAPRGSRPKITIQNYSTSLEGFDSPGSYSAPESSHGSQGQLPTTCSAQVRQEQNDFSSRPSGERSSEKTGDSRISRIRMAMEMNALVPILADVCRRELVAAQGYVHSDIDHSLIHCRLSCSASCNKLYNGCQETAAQLQLKT